MSVSREPKKGGAGGHNWGRPGDELIPSQIDQNDPLYDSDEEDKNVVFSVREVDAPRERTRSNSHIQREPSNIDAEEFKSKVQGMLHDFFASGDATETVRSLIDLNAPQHHSLLVKRAVIAGLDRHQKEQQQVSALFALGFSSKLLTAEQLLDGFKALFQSMEDLTLDYPTASDVVLEMFACAIKDGVLSLSAINCVPEKLLKSHGSETLKEVIEMDARGSSDDEDLPVFKNDCNKILNEYFVAVDIDEARARLKSLRSAKFHSEFVKRALTMAMDRKDKDRQSVSQLLSGLYNNPLTSAQISHGFDCLLDRVADLQLDTPNASNFLASFLARAIFDEIIPPAYVTVQQKLHLTDSPASQVLSMAHGLLSQGAARMERIWGPAREVEESIDELKKQVTLLVQELFSSGDIGEAVRCVRELDIPISHHQVVKRALEIGLERGGQQLEQVETLLRTLRSEGVVEAGQMAKGFSRLQEQIDDLKLDMPGADAAFSQVVERAKSAGLIPQ
eukprot:GILI01002235.1.p1 GENE.GILI01002235.1~~GILI01002235.1.p1  ORF type:complete len:506 (+),score=174.33 GILI01002235.1:131-1648(+)